MTREELDNKVDSLLSNSDFVNEIKKRVNKAVSQGCVNIDSYDNDFRLAKMLVYCAIEDFAWQYKPLESNRADQIEINNIKMFM
jgi:hypothetical protein